MAPGRTPVKLPGYAELFCRSNFSFLTGASHPEELIEHAQELRYAALALTDECSVAGVVRAHAEAKRLGFPFIVGASMRLASAGGDAAAEEWAAARAAAVLEAAADAASAAASISSSSSQSAASSSQLPKSSMARALPSLASILTAAFEAVDSVSVSAAESPPKPKRSRRRAPPPQAIEPQPARAVPGGGHAAAASPREDAVASPAAQCASATATDSIRPGPHLVLLAQTRRGYGNLSHWISVARRRAAKGEYLALTSDLEGRVPMAPMLAGLPDCVALLVASAALESENPFETLLAQARWLAAWFGPSDGPSDGASDGASGAVSGGGGRAWLALPLLLQPQSALLVDIVQRVSALTGLRIVAVGDVLMHVRSRKPLQDALTATRLKRPVAECGHALGGNGEQHLRPLSRLARLYKPEWLAATLEIAATCTFSLDQLRYEYPREIVPAGHTPGSWLRELTEQGLQWRYPAARGGVPPPVRADVEHELALIARLQYEPYFLTVADVVRWARSQGILCQGRGSAANSVVCYVLGVTDVDPGQMTLLFERFVSAERNEPPDIDIDFEHQRREEVIQYIYRKYGRHRAALTAVVISYRPRSALRDMGRALGIDLERIEAVAKTQHWFDGRRIQAERLRENGFDPASPLARLWVELTEALIGFPRHLSQHPGGFVIARDDLTHLVPVENAAMPDRSVIQWDKDDLDALGLLKVDILALGMLSAIRRALEMVRCKLGAAEFTMRSPPQGDAATYEMLCRGDSVGTFQVESRAQMSMLPRLRPECFYDLVIQVAIVRPGPIQGGMVHPYLRRRSGLEPVDYPSPEVQQALGRTLGVPIFQEQVMQLAMLAADFTGGEADKLRRAMAAWKRKGGLGPFHGRLVGRMVEKGYALDYAERIFKQIEGFGEYGFPESHAASFANLVYVSAWIKCHHPDAFLAALLNSQPMGFYAPAQLVRDAREHGVTVLPVDVLKSDWETTLEELPSASAAPSKSAPVAATFGAASTTTAAAAPPPGLRAVRLGFSRITGFAEDAARLLVGARAESPFASAEDLARRAQLDAHALSLLAHADALRPLAGHRHDAAWAVAGVDTRATPLLHETRTHEDQAQSLAVPDIRETVAADYRSTGLSLAKHPIALLRARLAAFKVQPAAVLRTYPNGRLARASGIVTHRQRPETAKGVIFVTLEDETGAVNVIVWPQVAETQRKPLLAASLLTVYGVWQCEGEVRHLVARKLVDHTAMLQGLAPQSRNFR